MAEHGITITAEQAQELARLAAGAAEVLAKRPMLAPSLSSGSVRAPGAQTHAQRLRQLASLLLHQMGKGEAKDS